MFRVMAFCSLGLSHDRMFSKSTITSSVLCQGAGKIKVLMKMHCEGACAFLYFLLCFNKKLKGKKPLLEKKKKNKPGVH